MALVKREKATETVSVYLTPTVIAQLNDLAEEYGVKRAVVLREVMAEGLALILARSNTK